MTTVAYRDGVLAADSAVCGDKRFQVQKIVHGTNRKGQNVFFGACGFLGIGEILEDYLINGNDYQPTSSDDWAALVIVDGVLHHMQGKAGRFLTPIPRVTYAATGSGQHYALGAMAFGASAIRSVQIASIHDDGTDGDVLYINTRAKKPTIRSIKGGI